MYALKASYFTESYTYIDTVYDSFFVGGFKMWHISWHYCCHFTMDKGRLFKSWLLHLDLIKMCLIATRYLLWSSFREKKRMLCGCFLLEDFNIPFTVTTGAGLTEKLYYSCVLLASCGSAVMWNEWSDEFAVESFLPGGLASACPTWSECIFFSSSHIASHITKKKTHWWKKLGW